MPIKNYTTSIDPAKTAGELQALLVARGAQRIAIDYEGRTPIALTFTILIGGVATSFRLAPDVAGTLQAMKDDRSIPPRLCKRAQARRVAWRIEKDWIISCLDKVAAGTARLEQLLLGYGVTPTGQTFTDFYASLMAEHGHQLNPAGA